MLDLGFDKLSMEPVVCAEDDPSALTAEDMTVVMEQYEKPAVPILVCGERITAHTLDCFEYYGITECCVTKVE